jgi:hypothetical protein
MTSKDITAKEHKQFLKDEKKKDKEIKKSKEIKPKSRPPTIG